MIRYDPTRWRVPLGFVLTMAYIALARPSLLTVAVGAAVALAGLVLRAYASGHIRKNDVLAVSGPYRYCRNPLYLGSLILAAGFLIAADRWLLALAALLLFAVVYEPVIRHEERFLAERFGQRFTAYAASVPRLWPRRPDSLPLEGVRPQRFSWILYRRHREYQALLGFIVMTLFLIWRCRFAGDWPAYW